MSTLRRTTFLVVLLLLPSALAHAQDRDRESRTVSDFREVEFALPGTLHVRQGSEHSLEIEASQDVMEHLSTEVDRDVLEIGSERDSGLFGWLFGDDLDGGEIDVYVTAPSIRALSVAGSGKIVGETVLEAKSIELNIAGSGDMDLDVATEQLDIRVAGSGTLFLRGRAGTLTSETAGSGNIHADALQVATADVQIAGSGNAELHVTERLEVQIFGSGDVRYRGSPSVDVSSRGSGDVSRIE